MMIIKKQKKELVVFTILLVITIALTYVYVYDPFDASLSEIFLRLVDSEYLKGK